MRTVICLSVTLVYYGQTVGWIKMPHGKEVGLGRGHIVLDGDPATATKRGTAGPNFALARSLISASTELLLRYVSRQDKHADTLITTLHTLLRPK